MSPPLAARTWAALLAVPLLASAAAPRASAQSYTWVGTFSNPNWSVTSNWSSATAPGTIPNGAGAAVLLIGSNTADPSVDGTFTIGQLTFDQTTSFSRFVGGAGGLTLNNNGSNAVVQVVENSNGAGNGHLNVPVTIGGNNALTLLAPRSIFLYVAGTVSGTGSSLSINAGGQTGTVALIAENNAYGGAGSVTTLNGGVLQATDGGGLPSNTALALNNGVWLPGYGDRTITRAVGMGEGVLRLTGGAAGFTAGNATLAVRLGNGTGAVTWGTPAFNPSALILGQNADGMTVLENGLDLNGADRTVRSNGLVAPGRPGGLITGAITNSAGTAGLITDGTGIMTLTGANTYNGTTTVRGGVLRANDGAGLPTTSNLHLQSGALESIGTAALNRSVGNGPGQVQFGAGGLSASGGTLTVQLNGGPGTITWGSPGFQPSGQPLRFGSGSFDGVVDFQNGLDLAGSDQVLLLTGPTTGPAGIARLSGPVGNGGLVVFGSPGATVELAATNTYTGQTQVFSGSAVRANDGVGLPTASHLNLDGGVLEGIGETTFGRQLGTGSNQVRIGFAGGFSASGGTMTVQLNGGTGTLNWGDLSGGGGGGPFRLQLGSRTADALTDFQNGLNLGAEIKHIAAEDNVRSAGDVARISGVVSGTGFNKIGAGTLELTAGNTYGLVIVQDGAVRAVDGVGLPTAAKLGLQGGVFEGLGPATFTRTLGVGAGQVQLGYGGGFSANGGPLVVQLNGGTGPLVWGSPGFFDGGGELLRFGSATANDVADFQNPIDLSGGTRFIHATGNPGYSGPVGRISGVISNGGLIVNNNLQA